ncbi:hypothetical protein Tco_0040921 [Tanacetum coccineum]
MKAEEMISPVTRQEIKAAIFDIEYDKAPGQNGFTSKFYKSTWKVVGVDVCKAIKELMKSLKKMSIDYAMAKELAIKVGSIMRLYETSFRIFFQEEYKTFSVKIYHNLNQLQWNLERKIFHSLNPNSRLKVFRTPFKEFFNWKEVNASDFRIKCWQKNFKDYTGWEPETYRRILLWYLDELDKLINERNQGTWKLSQLKNLSFEEVKEEFDKLVKQTSKRLKSDEAKDDESTKKTGKRRKQIAWKGLHSDKTDEDESEDSKDADPNLGQGKEGDFGAMLKDITRDDLTELYRIVMNRYGMNGPEDELEKVNKESISWRYYNTCKVHCLNLESSDIYMLIERKYPLTAEVCKVMLDKKLQGGKPDEIGYKL